ncbi:hypothetical protein RKD29_005719 [Streptomyces tendae]|uniref:hypothetical protein n=1 Tax=Streptomyces tendae TaxID=1932 RepID=UPI0038382B90
MPSPAKKGRELIQGVDASGTFPVQYRFAHAKGGNRHLVVVFANFAVPEDYGWSNGVFDPVRANILWIKDRFDGHNSYYLCKGMDFSLENSVAGLIFRVMEALGLTRDDVTMWGGSKGGSAALYFGLRYGFRNIVSLVPQFLVGTYVQRVHPKVATFMLGEGVPETNVRAVDAILPDLVRSEVNRTANIYLLSSPQDEQYPEQVEPFLGLFQRYENFNFVFSDSPYITEHSLVTRRNVPFLMGLVNMLADGIAPRLGMVRNGYEQPDRDRSGIDTFLAATSVLKSADVFPPPLVTGPAQHSQVPRSGPRFTGTAQGAERVSLWEHGRFLGQTNVAADGTWSWELGRAWSQGKHLVRLFGVHRAGYQSERTEVHFTAVEGAAAVPAPGPAGQQPPQGGRAPRVVISTPEALQQVGPAVAFRGFAQGAAEVRFWENGVLLGAAAVASDGGWAWDSGWPWPEGMHAVEVRPVDGNGVEGPPASTQFAVLAASAAAGYYGSQSR